MFYQTSLGFEIADSPLWNIKSHISQFAFLLMLGRRSYMKFFLFPTFIKYYVYINICVNICFKMCLGLHFPKSQSWEKDLGSGSLLQRWFQEALMSCVGSGGGQQEGEEAHLLLHWENRAQPCQDHLRADVNDCSYWRGGIWEHAQWISIQYWLRDAPRGVESQIGPICPLCNVREKVFRKYVPELQDCEWQRDKSQPLAVCVMQGIMKSVSMRRVIHYIPPSEDIYLSCPVVFFSTTL